MRLDLCAISRRLNAMTGGSRDEMLCSRMADRPWFQIPVDALFWRFRGDSFHCAWCADQDRSSPMGGKP